MTAQARAPIWSTGPTRFAGLAPVPARIVLVLFALLLAACLSAVDAPGPRPSTPGAAVTPGRTDLLLYQSIVDGVRQGGDYYDVAASAQRVGHYPLRPFFTMRLPTLAVVQASLPPRLVRTLLLLLCAATVLAWTLRLRPAMGRPLPVVAVALLAVAGLYVNLDTGQIVFHEVWAGPLIALSLALRRPGDGLVAIALGLCAMLIRETALLYALVMLAAAWREGRRREALGWLASIAVFAVVLAAHARAMSLLAGPNDLASQGWSGLEGFGFFVRLATISCALDMVAQWLASLLIGAALLGWAAWRDPTGTRATATIAAYAALIALFARSDNFYWALAITPLLPIGLVFAPGALRDLAVAAAAPATGTRRITVTRIVR
ncbi:hypothetical protein [Sphingomonas rubra]|uniref:Dolichyl-phosphate-mannose-protein mannosyltransferase n=1 Tax=Sphingomonas rubra TaxID=634430 RepID=A0A1I5QWZ5_9SPHN|nr:hypothetical protein [Sphingomonas rubra]SFP50789.1 hypothetical protein SAMN04488241_102350 [Sphingomonas rubra]